MRPGEGGPRQGTSEGSRPAFPGACAASKRPISVGCLSRGTRVVEYRCAATSVAGFIQQLAVAYVGGGYWYYVTGSVPERKDPRVVDEKLVARYGIGLSKWARARRKQAGWASVQYIRHQRFFVLLATHGKHRFFEEEA